MKLLGKSAVGDRDECGRRYSNRTRYAGHYGYWNPGAQAGEHLFCTPAENERVATLQPNHEPARQGIVDQRSVDVILRHGPSVWDLGGVDYLHVGRQLVEQRARPKPVGDDNICVGEQLPATDSNQTRVSWAAAHKRDAGEAGGAGGDRGGRDERALERRRGSGG